jgi:tellurite resistance protein
MYCDKTGKPAKEMLDIMKKGAWLNAEETKKLGFVDEIITPDKITNYIEDERLVALIAGNDMPPLPRKSHSLANIEEDIAVKIKKEGDKFIENFKKLFSNNTKTKKEMSKLNAMALLCALMAVDAIEMTDDGVFLNKEQLDKIEAELKKMKDLNTAKDAAVNALSTATMAMDELDPTVKIAETPIAKVEAIRKKLAEKPGVVATGTRTISDQTRKVIAGTDPVTAYAQEIV